MPKWNYLPWQLDFSMGVESLMSDLDDKGRQGWELVTVLPWHSLLDPKETTLLAIFKRPDEDG